MVSPQYTKNYTDKRKQDLTCRAQDRGDASRSHGPFAKVKLHKSQGSPFPLSLELQSRRISSSQVQDLNLFLNRMRDEEKIQADNKKKFCLITLKRLPYLVLNFLLDILQEKGYSRGRSLPSHEKSIYDGVTTWLYSPPHCSLPR